MKKMFIMIILLIAFFPVVSLFSQSASLIFFPVSGRSDEEETAKTLEDLMRVELINSNRVILKDRNLVEQTLADLGAYNPEAPVGDDSFLEAAKQLDSDLYLAGNLGMTENGLTLTLELISANLGTAIYTRSYDISGNIRRDAKLLSTEITDAVSVAENIRIDDIRLLVEMGKYREADTLLKRYGIFNSGDTEAEALQEMIHKGLAEEAFKEAEEYRNLYAFDEALISINEAVSYDPDNTFYQETIREIQEEAQEFRKVEMGKIINTVEQLVEERRFRVAQGLLEELYNRGAKGKEIQQLNEMVRRGLQEIEHIRQANLAYFNRNYLEAQLELREAIRINPGNPDYARFMKQIEERDKKLQESRRRWSSYRSELFSLDPVDLFLDKKRLTAMHHIGLSLGSWNYRDKKTLENETFPLTVIEGGYDWKQMLPYLRSIELAEPYISYGYGGRLGTGTEESKLGLNPEGFEDLEIRRVVMGQLLAAGNVELMVLSFLTRFGLEAGIGGNYNKLYERSPAADPADTTENVTRSGAVMIHGGWRAGLSWLVNKNFRLRLNWNKSYALFLPKNDTKEKFEYRLLFIGAAFLF